MKYCLFLLAILCYSCAPNELEENDSFDDKLDKAFPFEGYYDQKNYPDEQFDYKAYHKAFKEASQSVTSRSVQGEWEVQGPGNIGARINTVALDVTNPNVMYLGFSQGGVFKTTDNGENWLPIFDHAAYMAISDIEMDPSDAETIYIGTGDLNISGYPFIGDGIHKSTDGGNTWQSIGLEAASIISKIHVSPNNPDVIYASAMGIPFERNPDRGVYKSLDAGTTWEQILMINDSTGVIDMLVDPNNDDIVYAAGWNRIRNNNESKIAGPDAKIWKTVNGGSTWEVLEGGLPFGEFGRIGLAMSGINSNTIFASYSRAGGSDSCSTNGIDLYGIFKSEDGGQNWSVIPTLEEDGLPCTAQGGFAWYFGKLAVNPTDDDDIFVLGVDMYRTNNSGETWDRATPPWWEYSVHADKHDLVFLNDTDYILATDGGAYRYNGVDDQYTDIENIPATQFYRVAYNPWETDNYYGGAQDNGTTGGNAEAINEWERIFGGDGFQAIFDPTNPDIFYVETQNGSIRVTDNGGNDFFNIPGFNGPKNWDTPYIMSAFDANTLYAGSDRVYKNTGGPYGEWNSISFNLTDSIDPSSAFRHDISTLHESPLNPNLLYVGTSDGWAWRTVNGGSTWDEIIDGIPRRYVSDVKASPDLESNVFLGITGYKYNEFIPHIFKSEDYGTTWQSINGNLPQFAVNDIYVLPTYEDQVIFVATDGGVYMTIDGGVDWKRLGDNMPTIPVYDLTLNEEKFELVAGTYARGIQSFNLNQVDLFIPSSLDEQKQSITKVYPTVTNDVFIIESEEQKLSYEIIDASGRIVKNGKVNTSKANINIQGLIPGNYFVRCLFDDEFEMFKLIKI